MRLAVDLFCGLGGWSEALLAEGWQVVGFDIEQHVYGEERYPGQLVIQDVLTLHGSQFRDADLIVASPPCTEFSYMAMPWSRAKQIARALRGEDEFPEGYRGSRTVPQLTALFDACFRIQREASEAAGRHIPLVVENVRGAQPWVGRAAWNFGSFYLWGDVPALMPVPEKAQKYNPDGTQHGAGSWFAVADSKNRGARGTKNDGGSWFNVAHNTTSGVGRNPVHEGQKAGDQNAYRASGGTLKSARFTNADEQPTGDGVKCGSKKRSSGQAAILSGVWAGPHGPLARKAASARIAKIPPALALHVARCFRPRPPTALPGVTC